MRKILLISLASAVALSTAVGAHTGGAKLHASLSGAAEVPGPGDPDGAGTADVTVNAGQRKICYHLTVRNIGTATMAHIHAGAKGVAGPPKVTLKAPTGGMSHGCVSVSRQLALDILKHPGAYYANVHNAEFANGAIRGQLGK